MPGYRRCPHLLRHPDAGRDPVALAAQSMPTFARDERHWVLTFVRRTPHCEAIPTAQGWRSIAEGNLKRLACE